MRAVSETSGTNIKHTNIQIIMVPGEEEKKKEQEKIFDEIIVENTLNIGKKIATQIQEAQTVPHKIKPKRIMPRHILIKLTKINTKKKNINRSKGKRNKYTRKSP